MRKIVVTWIIGRNPIRATLKCKALANFTHEFTVITFARKRSRHPELNTELATNFQTIIANKLFAVTMRGLTVIDKITFDGDLITLTNHSFPWSEDLIVEVQKSLQEIEEAQFDFIPPSMTHSTTTMNLQ